MRVDVRPVVAGVDHEVRLEVGQAAHPGDLVVLARGQVQVGQVQHAQRPLAGRQHRHGEPAQRERVRLGQRPGESGPGGQRRAAPSARPSGAIAHSGLPPAAAGWHDRRPPPPPPAPSGAAVVGRRSAAGSGPAGDDRA